MWRTSSTWNRREKNPKQIIESLLDSHLGWKPLKGNNNIILLLCFRGLFLRDCRFMPCCTLQFPEPRGNNGIIFTSNASKFSGPDEPANTAARTLGPYSLSYYWHVLFHRWMDLDRGIHATFRRTLLLESMSVSAEIYDAGAGSSVW